MVRLNQEVALFERNEKPSLLCSSHKGRFARRWIFGWDGDGVSDPTAKAVNDLYMSLHQLWTFCRGHLYSKFSKDM